jgi:hypothetical protein
MLHGSECGYLVPGKVKRNDRFALGPDGSDESHG